MAGTRFRQVLRQSLGNIHREFKVAITPVPTPQKWLFLVGCYNSGTTLFDELLSRHPAISALPTEGHFITDQFVTDYAIGLPRMWVGREECFRLTENDAGPDPVRIKKEWAMRLDTSKAVLLEKSPPNSARTRWLQKHFENAHFIGIVRNGYAVAEGISRKAEPMHSSAGWSVEQAAWQWKRGNDVLTEDARFLQHFMWAKYEDLVADPQTTLNKIASFISIADFDSVNLNESLQIHEREEALRDLNQQSIVRLSQEEVGQINAVARECLEQFDYEIIEQ